MTYYGKTLPHAIYPRPPPPPPQAEQLQKLPHPHPLTHQETV